MNKIIKTICEILGEPQKEGGYKLPFNDIQVPILLNKDKTTTYPEIRLSPFISNDDAFTQRYNEKTLRDYEEWRVGKFQIDIFAKSVIEVDNIYQALRDRIYDFLNLEILVYCDNEFFEKAWKDDNGSMVEHDYYRNLSYANGYLFTDIYHIEIQDKNIERVLKLEDLTQDTFFVDENALYIKTNDDLSQIKISVITQGRLFNNKDSISNRGIAYYDVDSPRNLSELETNEVERISFDLVVVFALKRTRDKLPGVNALSQKSYAKW